jgi:endonuclease III
MKGRKRARLISETAMKEETDEVDTPASPEKLLRTLSSMSYSPALRTRSKRAKVESPPPESPEQSLATPIKKPRNTKPVATSAKKPKPIQTSLDTPHAAPTQWEAVYELIKEMRKGMSAPVDTMGCAHAMTNETDPRVCHVHTAACKLAHSFV